MEWNYVIQLLISGYLPAAAALALYFLILRSIGKNQSACRIAMSFVFCFYLIGVLTMTGICRWGAFSPRIVLIPFADMIRGPVDTALNVLLFIPLGVFFPILYEKQDNLRRIAVAGFLISLSIELSQMFGDGISDINDLITNTLGACLGFGIYRLLRRVIQSSLLPLFRAKDIRSGFELTFLWISLIVIMSTVQIPIRHALFPVT